MQNSGEVICKNCGNHFTGKYCNACGEKAYNEYDKHILHYFEDAVHFITHFEGTFLTTLKTLFTKPGKLSEDYCAGIRKKYFRPLPFFLMLVVLYLLFPAFEGLNMRLQFYNNMPLLGNMMEHKISALMTAKGLTFEEVSEAFKIKAEKIAKILLILLIPVTAIFLYFSTSKRRPYFFDQLVFATEINIIYLMWGFLILPILLTLIIWVMRIFHAEISFKDSITGVLIYLPMIFYIAFAIKRFYRFKIFITILLTLLITFLHITVVLWIYKILLFFITTAML